MSSIIELDATLTLEQIGFHFINIYVAYLIVNSDQSQLLKFSYTGKNWFILMLAASVSSHANLFLGNISFMCLI